MKSLYQLLFILNLAIVISSCQTSTDTLSDSGQEKPAASASKEIIEKLLLDPSTLHASYYDLLSEDDSNTINILAHEAGLPDDRSYLAFDFLLEPREFDDDSFGFYLVEDNPGLYEDEDESILLFATWENAVNNPETTYSFVDLEKAIELGIPNATWIHGFLSNSTILTSETLGKKGLNYLETSAEQGDTRSMLLLATFFTEGTSWITPAPEKAVYWYETAIQAGDHYALLGMGGLYLQGLGVEQDTDKALDYFFQAAEHEIPEAIYIIGQSYAEGSLLEQDFQAAETWLLRAANLNNASAQFALAVLYGPNSASPGANTEDYLEWLFEAANNQHPQAQFLLAIELSEGLNVSQDLEGFLSLLIQSGLNGHVMAQKYLAEIYFSGDLVEPSIEDAMYWLSLAAQQGDSDSLYALGFAYYLGDGVEQNYQQGMEYMEYAAETGHSGSMVALGEMYREGLAVEQDNDIAREWFLKAIETDDNASAYLPLAALTYQDEEALKLVIRGAEKGAENAISQLIEWYSSGQYMYFFPDQTIKWLEEGVNRGNHRATHQLGYLYLLSDEEKISASGNELITETPGIWPQDYARAMEYFEIGAELGYYLSMHTIGYMHQYGLSVPENTNAALEWYNKAIEAGDYAGSYNNIGNIFYETDQEEGIRYYLKAADLGLEVAINYLIDHFNDGFHLDVDIDKTLHWLETGVERGNEDSVNRLANIYNEGILTSIDREKEYSLCELSRQNGSYYENTCFGNYYFALAETGMMGAEGYQKAAEYYLKTVENNQNPGHAMHRLGWMYDEGLGFEENNDTALEWYQRSLENGNFAVTTTNIGRIFMETDVAKGLEYYDEAARRGDETAINNLINLFVGGQHHEVDPEKTLYWLEVAWDRGNIEGANWLGNIYTEGNLTEANSELAHYYCSESLALENYYGKTCMGNYLWLFAETDEDYRKSHDFYMDMADEGDALAMHRIGMMYADGLGVEKNREESIEWYERAIEADDLPASWNNLGVQYFDTDLDQALEYRLIAAEKGYEIAINKVIEWFSGGSFLDSHIEQALYWLEEGVSRGNMSAATRLSDIYADGDFVEQNQEKSRYYCQVAEDAGYIWATNCWGNYYMIFAETPEESLSAINYYQESASKGSAFAMHRIGWIYDEGLGVEEDNSTAEIWYERAIETDDYAASWNNLGRLYFDTDRVKSVEYRLVAAEKGDSVARGALEDWFTMGAFIDVNVEKSLYWLEEFLEEGNMLAANTLGDIYKLGELTEQDTARSFEYFQTSAEAGNGYGLYSLSKAYSQGLGTETDAEKAKDLLIQALIAQETRAVIDLALLGSLGLLNDSQLELIQSHADSGNITSMYFLGNIFRIGAGVAIDAEQSFKYAQRAASAGFPPAQYLTAQMIYEQEASNTDIAEAYKWALLASENRYPAAAELATRIEEQLDAVTISTVKKETVNWLPDTQ